MRVLHVNTNESSGGAARAAHRLHTGLRAAGCDSSMYVLHRQSARDPHITAFTPPRDLRSRVQRRFRREVLQRRFARYASSRPGGLEPFTQARTQHGSHVLHQLPPADVINLHWIRGFVDLPAFFEHITTPVVWTLHDQNAFTGGCHYDNGCDGYAASCGACPQLGSKDLQDLSRRVWQRKRDAYAAHAAKLHIVTPSRWLAEEARRSTLLEHLPITVIPYGLDTEVFAPCGMAAARAALGLPPEARIALFVAQSVRNQRKGFAPLLEALRTTTDVPDLHLLSIGGNAPDVEDLPVPHVPLGRLTSDRLLAAAYSAADVFVAPSLQDNLPNTVLEAMACGTPVVGFDAGGIPDMVRPGKTGWLAETGNVRALRDALEQSLNGVACREQLGANAREVAVEEYTLEVQAQRHVTLYERLQE